REIYLKAFEGSFVKGGSTGTMTAFNRVGLTYAGAHRALLKDLLRGEWGFCGATISDAANFPYQHPVEGIANGTDIWCTMGETDRDKTIRAAIVDNDDGNLFRELRESQHGLYYMFANSNLINGLTSNMKYVTHTPWWQTALYAVDAVLALATLAFGALYVYNTYLKKEDR
ncbi:MAG: hypothetical protein II794_07530, partial [Oscillospiraceae bacterium]|nr:hypothetical protein [Oscillospiraceae bacterium]